MGTKAISSKGKAFTLVPLALLSAAWTASIVTVGTSAVAARSDNTPLPDGSQVPSKAIEAPASVPVPGSVAPAVPDGTVDQVVAGASTNGIPSVALSAYQRGAQIMNSADTTCNIPWELIAAIGRVESDHGQYGGNTLGNDGIARPGIYGPELNGQHGTQAIRDTDGGALDHDPVFDRAVGPMQFLPSTWNVVQVDADSDGKRNPQDINDASLAAAVYLCSGKDDLATRAGQEAAVFRYNHSQAYVDLVLRLMEAYSQGDYTAIPSGTYGGTVFSPSYATAINEQQQANLAHPKAHHSGSHTSTSGSSGTGTPSGSGSGSGSGTTTPPSPVPTGGSDPISQALDQATSTLTSAASPVTKPVTDTLGTLAEAVSFCDTQFAAIPDPLGLLKGLDTTCAGKVQGMTPTDAAALIPNTLSGILAWLKP